MECRRDPNPPFDPALGRFVDDCPCADCVEERRVSDVLDRAELSLRAVVGQLVRSGMMPNDLVATVRRNARRKGSKATMLTRVELTCQAGWWLSRPEWADQLEQVDELRKYTGFQVGTTIPGWLHHWYARKGGYDLGAVTDGVLDVWIALADDLEWSADLADPIADTEGAAGSTGSADSPARRSGNVVWPSRWW